MYLVNWEWKTCESLFLWKKSLKRLQLMWKFFKEKSGNGIFCLDPAPNEVQCNWGYIGLEFRKSHLLSVKWNYFSEIVVKNWNFTNFLVKLQVCEIHWRLHGDSDPTFCWNLVALRKIFHKISFIFKIENTYLGFTYVHNSQVNCKKVLEKKGRKCKGRKRTPIFLLITWLSKLIQRYIFRAATAGKAPKA